MKFFVRFEGELEGSKGHAFPINIHAKTLGLDWVDKVRVISEVPDLDVALIDGMIPSYIKQEVVIPLDEVLARQANRATGKLFADSFSETVHVPDSALNKFVVNTIKLTRNDAHIVRQLNEEAVIVAWKHAGFPTNWDPSKESEYKGIETELSEFQALLINAGLDIAYRSKPPYRDLVLSVRDAAERVLEAYDRQLADTDYREDVIDRQPPY